MRRPLNAAGALVLALYASTAWAGTSTQQSPTVTFTAPGTKQVTLQVCNPRECNTVTRTITVLDPKPAVTSSWLAPVLPETGQLVFLTGAGTGKPPLAYTWQMVPAGGGAPVASFTGATIWWNTAGLPPGGYVASFRINNSAGSALAEHPLTLAPAAPLDFYTIEPCRLYDSRLGVVPVLSGVAKTVAATGGGCGIPAGARALAANVTVINPTGAGYATLYPGNYPQPAVSTVNFPAGVTRSNNAILPLATDGAGTLTVLLSNGGANAGADLTIDVSGYYMP